MPNTLASDLRAVAQLYHWADRRLGASLDGHLCGGNRLTGTQLQDFLMDLRAGGGPFDSHDTELLAAGTIAGKASAVRGFVEWSADPNNRGCRRSTPLNDLTFYQELQFYRAMLRETFLPFSRHSNVSQRKRPMEPAELATIADLIAPMRGEDGSVKLPIRFGTNNPFRPETQLRNWLMYLIALLCGLRRGELLKLRIDDMPKPATPFLQVKRRPHDSSDGRRYRPHVKTVERVLPISGEIRPALRAYLTGMSRGRRRTGKTPYLFVTGHGGEALSIAEADEVIQIVSKRSGIADLSWGNLRHTWAEGLAVELLSTTARKRQLHFCANWGGGSLDQ